jgi:hypothetical protein
VLGNYWYNLQICDMNNTEIKIRITNIIKKCAAIQSPKLLDVVSDIELYEAFEKLNEKCIQMKLKHDGYTLFEAVVRKLSYDKLYPNLMGDTAQNAIDYIRNS